MLSTRGPQITDTASRWVKITRLDVCNTIKLRENISKYQKSSGKMSATTTICIENYNLIAFVYLARGFCFCIDMGVPCQFKFTKLQLFLLFFCAFLNGVPVCFFAFHTLLLLAIRWAECRVFITRPLSLLCTWLL